MKAYGVQPLKLKKPKINKVKMPRLHEPKLPKLSFGNKRHKFGGGNDYYTKIFRQ
jgi:hypothetical protein